MLLVERYCRQSVRNYATFAATYLASYTLAHVFLKATDLSLEITDGLLIWSANEKVHVLIIGNSSTEEVLNSYIKSLYIRWSPSWLASVDFAAMRNTSGSKELGLMALRK